MITMNLFNTIKDYKTKGFSIRQISRKMKLSRKTVAKYYSMSASEYHNYLKNAYQKDRVFDPFKNEILEVYQRNDGKVYVSSLYDLLVERYGAENLPGSERTLRNYISWLNDCELINKAPESRIYRPVKELPFGKQLQVDFGQINIFTGETVYIFAAVLSASRYRYVSVQNRPFTSLDVILHLIDCFNFIGGIPEEIAIDQDRTMVTSENSGDIILTKTFKEFKEEMGFKLYVCRKADPESKGKVENLVKFVKTSFFSARSFNHFKEITPRLIDWLNRTANGRICQATGIVPASILYKEKAVLKPLRASVFKREAITEREPRKADAKSLISVGSSKYSVPFGFRNRQVWIYKTEAKLFIYSALNGKEIAQHKLSLIPGGTVINNNHFRDTSQKQKELRDRLLSRFQFQAWNDLVNRNYSRYNRYFREQYYQFEQFLKEDIDLTILEKAIDLCFETEGITAHNLQEAYLYHKGVFKDSHKDIIPSLITGISAIKNDTRNPNVTKRRLSYYTSLISILGGLL